MCNHRRRRKRDRKRNRVMLCYRILYNTLMSSFLFWACGHSGCRETIVKGLRFSDFRATSAKAPNVRLFPLLTLQLVIGYAINAICVGFFLCCWQEWYKSMNNSGQILYQLQGFCSFFPVVYFCPRRSHPGVLPMESWVVKFKMASDTKMATHRQTYCNDKIDQRSLMSKIDLQCWPEIIDVNLP